MPWDNSPEKRRRDQQTYGSPEYRQTRETVRRRANGTCEKCHHRHRRLQFDARIPVSQGGDHSPGNTWMLCVGEGSCKCHEKKTAHEGGGYRQPQSVADPEPRPKTNWG